MPHVGFRVLLSALSVIFVGLLDGPVLAAAQQDYDNCSQTNDLKLAIAACTRIADDQSESGEDRVSAILQIGNAYYQLNDLGKALALYSAADEIREKQNLHGPLEIQLLAAKAIAYWRVYQTDHDASKQQLALMLFQGATATDAAYFKTLVDGSGVLQEIKRYDEEQKKK